MRIVIFISLFLYSIKGYSFEQDKKYFLNAFKEIIEVEKVTKICLENAKNTDAIFFCFLKLKTKYTQVRRDFPWFIGFRDDFEKSLLQFQNQWDEEVQTRTILLLELKSCLKKEVDTMSIKTKCIDPFKGKYEKYESQNNFIHKQKFRIDNNQF